VPDLGQGRVDVLLDDAELAGRRAHLASADGSSHCLRECSRGEGDNCGEWVRCEPTSVLEQRIDFLVRMVQLLRGLLFNPQAAVE
jgi:hypothetical protein